MQLTSDRKRTKSTKLFNGSHWLLNFFNILSRQYSAMSSSEDYNRPLVHDDNSRKFSSEGNRIPGPGQSTRKPSGNSTDNGDGNGHSSVNIKGEISDIETDDENDLPTFPSRRSSVGTLLKEASAAAVTAAESNQETDSVLSDDEQEETDIPSSDRASFTAQPPPPNFEDFRRMSTATFNYISSAGIEQSFPSEPQMQAAEGNVISQNFEPDESFAEINHSWDTDGVLVENKVSESSIEHIMDESEQGLFSDFGHGDPIPPPDSESLQQTASSVRSESMDLLSDDISIDSSSNFGAGLMPIAETTIGVKDILVSAEIINEKDLESLEELRQQLSATDPDFSDDALMMYYIFLDFTIPSVSLESVKRILELEQQQKYSDCTGASESTQIPKDAVIRVVRKSKVLSIVLCQKYQVLLQLPRTFSLALFRILIRLLTNETDSEYNKKSLLTCEWAQESRDIRLSRDYSEMLDISHPGVQSDERSRLRTYSSVSISSESSDTKGKKPLPRSSLFSGDGSREYDSRKANQIYTMIRLQQSGTTTSPPSADDDKYAARKLLRLFNIIKATKSHLYLLSPAARLLGLICSAGVSEQVLLRLLASATKHVSSSKEGPPVARLLLIRALQTATDGASRSFLMMGKAYLRHFFSFGGGKGLTRTISGLTSWPFRNDFGMAVWFRAETFQNETSTSPILLSVRAEDGGGIEVSLSPLEEDKAETDSSSSVAAALVISIFDSGSDGGENVPTHKLRVPGCVLLPRVWYHVGLRHTRSRLKGVFSLSTRQQITIMLDGKSMLTESLSFPRVSEDDFQSENAATAFLQKAVRRSTSGAGLSLKITLGAYFDGQSGPLYLFHDNVSDATFRAIYEVNAGKAGTVKKPYDSSSGWDSHHGDIVKKSRILDVGIKKDDAEDIVLSRRRQSTGELVREGSPSHGVLSVMDLGDGDDPELEELPSELSRSAFGSKLFLAWDPSRTAANMVLELHIGAHVRMAEGGIQPWQIDGVQDVIGSVGGIQAVIPMFRSLLSGEVEHYWLGSDTESNTQHLSSKEGCADIDSREKIWSMIPDLLLLVASFVQDHGENARELLRCGGIDVIESFILASRKIASNNPHSETRTLFGPLTVYPSLSRLLVQSIVRLVSACSHYIGLETKVFARLLFNTPLWFSGSSRILGISLELALLPLLSKIVRANPEKVRDCVGIRDLVFLLKEYVSAGDFEVSPLTICAIACSRN